MTKAITVPVTVPGVSDAVSHLILPVTVVVRAIEIQASSSQIKSESLGWGLDIGIFKKCSRLFSHADRVLNHCLSPDCLSESVF